MNVAVMKRNGAVMNGDSHERRMNGDSHERRVNGDSHERRKT